tara:strand:- start:100 stop:657 length:558 start_codon:yes stop_codon:yes gene_type:complete
MPTQSTTYNSRVTDEALEKRFRDTFRSQGGAELVDDLYAQGVIVPIVDFTAAATGQQLAQNLQTAWDFSTGHTSVVSGTSTLISNSGFWQVDLTATLDAGDGTGNTGYIFIDAGVTTKKIWQINTLSTGVNSAAAVTDGSFVVFLRSGDSLKATSGGNRVELEIWYRQIATLSGDLVNPSGFTSS